MRHATRRRRGPKSAPLGRLTPEFFRRLTTSHASRGDLASVAGFAHLSKFSGMLHADRVPLTPLVVARFTRLAEALDFTGDLFEVRR